MRAAITTVKSTEIYRNRWMTLREDQILRADGSQGIYSVIEKDDFVVIVAVQDDEIYLVEQYRYPLGKRTLELPQGSWEHAPDAAPASIAAGELREETGLVAGKLDYVGYQKLAQGYSSQGYHIFLATELKFEGQQLTQEEQDLQVKSIKIAAFRQMILEGEISDATSVTAFLLTSAKNLLSD